jgi:hypothetical protein
MPAAASKNPFDDYLRVQRKYNADLDRILEEAARDAQRTIATLKLTDTLGARVRQAQLTAVLAEIRNEQASMWQNVGAAAQAGRKAAAEAAQEALEVISRVAYASLAPAAAEALTEGLKATARAGINTAYARVPRQLSEAVYRNGVVASGKIDDMIRRGLIQGLSAKEMAASVYQFVSPTTPGGASYAANRLARTEINNAFHAQQIAAADAPGVSGVKWNLSGSHPRPDECNDLAERNRYDMGGGVYPKLNVPSKPHPHCFCYLSYITMDPEEFATAMHSGKFDDEIRRRAQINADKLRQLSPRQEVSTSSRRVRSARQRTGASGAESMTAEERKAVQNEAKRRRAAARRAKAREAKKPTPAPRPTPEPVKPRPKAPAPSLDELQVKAREEAARQAKRERAAARRAKSREPGFNPLTDPKLANSRVEEARKAREEAAKAAKARGGSSVKRAEKHANDIVRTSVDPKNLRPLDAAGRREEIRSELHRQAHLTPESMQLLKATRLEQGNSFVGREFTDAMGKNVLAFYRSSLREIRLSPDWLDAFHDINGKTIHSRATGHFSHVQGEGLKTTVAHEYGHHLDFLIRSGNGFEGPVADELFPALARELGLRDDIPRGTGWTSTIDGRVHGAGRVSEADLDAWIRRNSATISTRVSKYAASSGFELFAEIWAEYSTGGPGRVRPYVKAIGDILRKLAEQAAKRERGS